MLLHELGHLVGLGHVEDPFQVMYDTNTYPLARTTPGTCAASSSSAGPLLHAADLPARRLVLRSSP